MTEKNGEQQLKKYAEESYPKKRYQINDRIWFFVGYGHSNCTVIEGETSLILIDTLDCDSRGAALQKEIGELTGKQVQTIIYTHGHPDHRGGSGAFRDTVQEIIAWKPQKPVLRHMDRIQDVLGARTRRQFGAHLSTEELVTQGLGIREGIYSGEGKYDFLPPTTLYDGEKEEREIDGVRLIFVSAVGETDDQIFVWLPDDRVLCCGDNYYGCFPNLYAVRGSQYRDLAEWADSLGRMLDYPADVLLPGHTKPVFGEKAVRDVLSHYRGAIESVLLQTLDCMNRGLSESETVQAVRLPEKYENKPYLGEFYGTVEWSVRAVYHGYVGWFDGNPANLYKLPDEAFAKRLVSLTGGEKLLKEARSAAAGEEFQMAAQLADLLILAGEEAEAARAVKAEALMGLAHQVTSANGRHYLMESARELERGKDS